MTRIRSLVAAVATALTAVVAWPTSGAAMNAEFYLDTSSVQLNDSTWVEGEITLRHLNRGFSNDVVVTGTLPPGFEFDSMYLRPSIVAGEISWNTNSDTRLFTFDMDSGEAIDGLQVILTGMPFEADPCGIYGLDIHPATGEYYALIGLQFPGDECEYQATRDLFKVDPVTGISTWIGSPAAKLNGLTFAPNGTLFGNGSNGAPRKGGVYTLSTANGSVGSFAFSAIPGASTTWNDASLIGVNHTDSLIYQFYLCQMATINASTAAKTDPVDVDTGDCPDDDYHIVSYLGDNQFLIFDWTDYSIFDLDTLEWDYITSADEDVRGGVASGGAKTALANCEFEGSNFECKIPRFVPRAQYVIEFYGDFTGTKTGKADFKVAVDSAAGKTQLVKTVNVVGADLKAFASADVQRVDDGDPVGWTIEAENFGTGPAFNTTLVIQIPDNQDYSSVSPSQGSCNLVSRTLTCNAGTVGAGNLVRVTLNTNSNAEALSELTVNVSTTSSESTLNDNSASARVVVGPAADLVVSAARASASASPAGFAAAAEGDAATESPGDPLPMNFTVTNLGPNSATAVTVRHVIPKNVELSNATSSKGSCNVANNVLTCALGDIDVDATVSIALSPTAVSAGTYSFTVSAESTTTPDAVLANNTATLKVGVLPPTLKIAAGPKNPSNGAEIAGVNSPVAQIQLTHGGETQQALRVNAFTVKGTFARILQDSIRIKAVHDADADGRADADERVLAEGSVGIVGDNSTLQLDEGIDIAAGETLTVVFVLAEEVGTATASNAGVSPIAALVLLPVALLFGLRRKALPLAVFAFVAFGAVGCTEEDLLENGARIKITLVGVDADLAVGRSPLAPVEGLPLEGPSVELK